MITKKPEKLEQKTLYNFEKHKLRNLPLYNKYFKFSPKKAENILECAKSLVFNLNEHINTKEHKITLQQMYTCKDRFCPFCNWRRQMKYSKMIYKHILELEERKKLRYIFLTLTVKNCHINDLKLTIKHMQKSFQRMKETVKWEKSILGFLRVLEFTVQKDDNNMIHPHFHILLAVEPSYFNPRYDKYLKKEDFAQMWKKALRVDYAPVVDVRIVKQNSKQSKNVNASVVAEMSKYPLKDTDIEKIEDFENLVKQLKNIRNINAGGIFKGILAKEKKIDDDLIHIDEENREELWIVIDTLFYEFESRNGKQKYFKK
jgi:plasmid rolling circle replication initiator protein Rep